MFSKHLRNRFIDIIVDAHAMVTACVDNSDLAEGINYASIYARSPQDFDQVSQELKNAGTVALERSSGNYYRLKEPFVTPVATITVCRVHTFDHEYPERGYVDFEVKNYQRFKEKYLPKPHFSLLGGDEEMIELKDPKFTVRAYFPSGDF